MRNNFSLKFKLFDIFVLAFAVILIVASIITTNVVFASPKNASKTVQIYYQGELLENLEVSLNDLNEEKFQCELDLEQAKEIFYQIRKNNIIFSDRLNVFYIEIQKYIYSLMTVEEAEKFFDEN